MNLLNLIVMASIAAVVLVSFDAGASCTATVTCKNEDAATCTAGGGAGSGYEVSICGITKTNKSRFCQTSSVNERGELYSERAELICCDKDGNAVSISGDRAEAVSAQVCASI